MLGENICESLTRGLDLDGIKKSLNSVKGNNPVRIQVPHHQGYIDSKEETHEHIFTSLAIREIQINLCCDVTY